MGNRPPIVVYLIAFFGFITILCLVGFMVGWRSDVASEEGAGIDRVISYLLIVTGLILVAGHAVLCVFLWKSAVREGADCSRPSKRAEWLWGLMPVLLMSVLSEAGVLVVGAPVWKAMYVDEPADPVRVQVIGKRFEWLVHYPGKDGKFGRIDWEQIDAEINPIGLDEEDENAQDDIIRRGRLHLPVGRPVVIRLQTQDVLHSFFVPDFRLKQDLIPGFPTRIKFKPTKTGDYELACAELCGYGHYQMRGTVHVLEPAEFEEWYSKQATFGE